MFKAVERAAKSSACVSIKNPFLQLKDFWHKKFVEVSKCNQFCFFVEKFVEKNHPIKATLTMGYNFFQEEFTHDAEGKLHCAATYSNIFLHALSLVM